MTADSASPTADRRAFLKRLALALGGFLGAALGVPVVGAAVAPAVRRDEAPWVNLGRVVDFAVGIPRIVTVGIERADGYRRTTVSRALWVWRPVENQLIVYNARCTHLGCLVSYRPDSQTFLSPCHAGVFALQDGRVLDGPPPRPLDRLSYRIEEGQLLVQYRDFLVGVPEQVPL